MRYAILLLPALLAAGEAAPTPPAPPAGEGAGRPARAQLFKRLDADGDGFLSLDELRAGARPGQGEHPPGPPPAGGEGQAPGQGGEGRPAMGELFERLDKDGDGKLSHEEFAVLRELLPRPGAAGPGPGPGPGRDPEQVLKRLDKDGDGRISLEEFEAGRQGPPAAGEKRHGAGEAPPAAK